MEEIEGSENLFTEKDRIKSEVNNSVFIIANQMKAAATAGLCGRRLRGLGTATGLINRSEELLIADVQPEAASS